MSRLYDIKESSLIGEEMLEKAVEEQGPQGKAGLLAKEEGLKYDEVTQLRLDYRNILKIDLLWQFTSLTKLQLDNNIIGKIEGLEKLTNLVWLDLSFNNIEVIEGLDTLVKLQDLILFNNRISVIENMDALLNIEIISLGNNLISHLDNVIYLRKFNNLRTLDLAGNPICKDENYKVFVAAHLPHLVYLDYRLLDEQTREKAQYQYQTATEKIKHSELEEQKAAEAQKAMEQELQLHKTQLEALCMKIFEAGLTQQTQRQNEVECFFTSFRKAIADNQQKGAQIVADFERSRRQVLAEMKQASDRSLLKDRVRNEIMQIRDTLLTLEMQLVAQLEDITKDFERNITDMVGGFAEYCRDLENHHHENVLTIAVATLKRVAKNELDEDLPDEMQLLFVDKDTMTNAVSASHDTHLLKIDNREDALLTRIHDWKSALIKSIHDNAVKRNRKRISEILKYVDYALDQLELLPDYQKQN
ncbi:hypothetical protein QTP70_024051 [Hemibagrus guttatus]|uniref:Dynein regulatory complex subunit 3 n=1 Tax=Hemibagrus guttatus TaxID=175788 RepID=A0AAE0UWH4_9TELE|nr:hypothetical protein QTP70_024051 [Hemibagrus guttatus]